jgi:hypothetical protein
MDLHEWWKAASYIERSHRVAKEIFGLEPCKPSHGPCCTCQTCGHDYDSCICNLISDEESAYAIIEKMADMGYSCDINFNKDLDIYYNEVKRKLVLVSFYNKKKPGDARAVIMYGSFSIMFPPAVALAALLIINKKKEEFGGNEGKEY